MWLIKDKLDFAPSVNLGPIIVDNNKKKTDVPVGTELAMLAFYPHVIF